MLPRWPRKLTASTPERISKMSRKDPFQQSSPHPDTDRIDEASGWPSRETAASPAPATTQLNIKVSQALAQRFRGLCKQERYSGHEMLEKLMDHYQRTGL